MKSFLALVHREYLEHKLAYVIAPAVLVALFAAASLYVFAFAPDAIEVEFPIPSALKAYEVGYGLLIQGWWYYTLASLFFFYADSFHGDTRNNAMLFWKSMPQSDLKVSASKLAVGLTVFPAAIFLAALVTGLLLMLPASAAAPLVATGAALPLGDTVTSWLALSAVGLAYFAFGLLWYAPFFAWVGLLSTILGRWSIPLAFLVPAVVVIFEILVIRPASAPDGSYVLAFLSDRANYGFGDFNLELTVLLASPIDAAGTIADMAAGLDWATVAGGLAVAALLVAASAEYRRRHLLT